MKSAYKGVHQPKDGVFIHGLFLEAARWDYDLKILADPNPGEIFFQIHSITFVICCKYVS